LETNVHNFKDQNTKLSKLSNDLRNENETLHENVKNLSHSIEDLNSVKDMIEAFAQKNNQDLGDIIGSMKDTLSKQQNVLQQQKEVMERTKQCTKSQELVLLHHLQSQVSSMDGTSGLSEVEYNSFVAMCPQIFAQKLKKFSEVDLSGNGNIEMSEFQALVNEMVQTMDK